MKEIKKYPYNRTKRIPTDATIEGIAKSIKETLKEIKLKGSTPELDVELFLKYARLKFGDKKYVEAKSILSQCNCLTIENALSENHEIYYWTGRVEEAKGNIELAKTIYYLALERFQDNPNLVSHKEIVEAYEKVTTKQDS